MCHWGWIIRKCWHHTKTSIALKSSGTRAQKRNKTANHFQEPGTYSVQQSSSVWGAADYLRWKSNFEKTRFEIFYGKKQDLSQDKSFLYYYYYNHPTHTHPPYLQNVRWISHDLFLLRHEAFDDGRKDAVDVTRMLPNQSQTFQRAPSHCHLVAAQGSEETRDHWKRKVGIWKLEGGNR